MKTPAAIFLSLGLLSLCLNAEVDFTTAGMQKLKQGFEREQAQADARRVDRLHALILKNLKLAEAMLQQKKVAGNISGMAAARMATRTLKRGSGELTSRGDFEVPAKVRHELTRLFATLREEKAAIETDTREAVQRLTAKYHHLLADQIRKQGATPPDPDALKRYFQALLSAVTAAPDADETEPAEPPPDRGKARAPTESRSLTEEIAVSGQGSNWVTFADWNVETYGLEIIAIPVVNQREPTEKTGGGVMSGQPYKARLVPVRVLPAAHLYAFRANRLPNHAGVDILEWPGKGNGWTLQVRARPSKDPPSLHGLELQVSGPGADKLPRASEKTDVPASAESQTATNVRIFLKTRPEGALVYVGRKLVREGGEPARTPCTISLTAGLHQLVLRKRGYLDAVFEELEATEGLRVNWDFKKNPGYEKRKVRVSARSAWQPSGIEIEAGDHLLLKASGEWSCGKKREKVGPTGYPNDKDFFHYYFDPKSSPRQLSGVNYGAPLMRIGEKGRVRRVGKGRKVAAETSGMLYLDVNEAVDGRFRRDNTGTLTVEVHKVAAPSR